MEKNRTGSYKILILGASGMAGHKFLDYFSIVPGFSVRGTVRNADDLPEGFRKKNGDLLDGNIDANDLKALEKHLEKSSPGIVINCVGLIKQLPIANDPLAAISINALFPHQLAHLCKRINARMIHISTDCVFSGKKGNYSEDDQSDAEDLYGKTKYLGEVAYPHCVTLRTSIIGHELKGNYGLVEWFMRQKGKAKGFTKAIYTGFPTIELARIIREHVIPKKEISGLYQVSSKPVSKYELLKIIASQYGKNIDIEPDDKFSCDRSLDSSRFRKATGYVAPPWEALVADMHEDYVKSGWYAEY
jgi:dTDP-4-dehydrorhamnose reductase